MSTDRKAYMITIEAPDCTEIKEPIYFNYDKALKRWNEEREKLINEKRETYADSDRLSNILDNHIKNLRNDDPNTINNFPHDTPRIKEITVDTQD